MMKKNQISKLKLTNYVKAIGLGDEKELTIVNGIVSVNQNVNNDFITIDCKDCIVSPGFIDPQVNGLDKCNFWKLEEKDFNEIENLRLKLALSGVVAFCPTLITNSKENIIKSIDLINKYIAQSNPTSGARVLGIHLEGFFITKYGVHESKYVQNDLTVSNIQPFIKENVILFTLAPELDKSGEAIKCLQKNNILVSIGHSNANYKQGNYAIEKYNLRTVTHMFNSLRGIQGFSHRGDGVTNLEVIKSKLEDQKKIDPENDGIILSILKHKDVLCMVIGDGIHVHKDVVGLLNQYKNNFSLVSDLVSVKFFNEARSKGMLGGGQTTLDKCVSNLIDWKVSNTEEALLSASKPIANQLLRAKEWGLGEISIGKEANLVLWNTKNNSVKGTIIGENVFLNY